MSDTPIFTCFVPGDPFGKAVTGGNGRMRFKDRKTESYMGRCIFEMRRGRGDAPAIDGPTRIVLTAFIRRTGAQIPNLSPRVRTEQPPEWAYPATCKPDCDNVFKGIGDSLTQAGVIVDDKRAVQIAASKWYVAMRPELGPTDVGVLVEVYAVDARARFGT